MKNIKYLRVASDLHLEFWDSPMIKKMLPFDERNKESILILAGDISCYYDQLFDQVQSIEDEYAGVILIPGNHEYYKMNMEVFNFCVSNSIKTFNSKIKWGSQQVVEFSSSTKDYKIITSTLWGDCRDAKKDYFVEQNLRRSMYDFTGIKLNEAGDRLTVDAMHDIAKNDRQFINDQLLASKSTTNIVVTHHLPSYRLIHPNYHNSPLNGGFANDCDSILAYDHAPSIWIYGHTHYCNDSFLWKTRMVSNPHGYPRETTSKYNPSFFIELE